MGQVFTTSTNRFDGGMDADVRVQDSSKSHVIKGFDALTYPHRLVPFRSSESGNDGTYANTITDFLQAEGNTFAIGRDASTAKTAVVYRTTYTDGAWTKTANNASGSLAPANFSFPCYYKGAIYGAHGSNSFFKYLTAGSGFTDNDNALAYTSIAQPVVHSKDDIMYVPYDNKIATKNVASWTSVALTLPSDSFCKSICEYSNYLAIGMAPLSTAGRQTSKVFLWARDTSTTTLSESVDWGPETLQVLEVVEGDLIGLSASSSTSIAPHLVLRRYVGAGRCEKVLELVGDIGTIITLKQYKQVLNGRIYFEASVTIDGSTILGVWSVGRNTQGRYSIALERLANNDSTTNSLYGFTIVGDYTFIAFNDGVSDTVSKTNDATAFVSTSICETRIFNEAVKNGRIGPDSSTNKKLIGISLSYAPMPSAGSVTVKYKADGDTNWTTIATRTYATTNLLSFSAVRIEATGATLPQYGEIRFRIESYGGVEVTDFRFDSEVVENAPY